MLQRNVTKHLAFFILIQGVRPVLNSVLQKTWTERHLIYFVFLIFDFTVLFPGCFRLMLARFTGCCLLPFAALSTHNLKYLGLFQMDSAVLTVLNSDILPHISTGAGTRRLPILHVVNTCDVFWAIPWILSVERRPRSVSSRLAPGYTLGPAGPIVKLGTAYITKDDHENLIVIGTPEASAASDAQLLPDQSRFSPSATNGLQSYFGISPDL